MPAIRPLIAAASLLALASGPALAQMPAPGDAPPAPGAHHAMPGHPKPHAARLSVTGEGQSATQPDMATISLGVSTEAATAQEAMAQNATRQQAVIDALKAEGIEARDIQTSGLNLSPRMVFAEGQPPKLSGYTAQNMVTVRVRDLARLGPVLDKLVETGANEINGIGFAREDMEAARDEARARAIAEARRRAEQMAGAAGMRLGALRALSDAPVAEGPRPMMMRAEAKAADATPIEAGELSVTAQVSAVYDLLPGDAPAPDAPAPDGEAPEAPAN